MKSLNVGGMREVAGEACAPCGLVAGENGPVQSDAAQGAERQAMHSLTRLLEIQRDLAVRQLGCENLIDYLEMLVESAARLPGFDCCGIYLCDEEGGGMRLIAHRGLSGKFIQRVASYQADSPQARLVHSGKLVYAMRADLPPEVAATLADEGLQLLAMVPLRDRGRVVAALNVSSRRQTCLEPASCIALETFAAQAEGTITHIRAREARQKAERQLQLAIEGAQLGSWAADFDIGKFEASDLARILHGLEMDFPLTVESAMEPIHPDDRGMVAEQLKRSIEFGEPFSTEYRTWMPGREGRWVHSEARIFDDAGRKRLYGIVRDVTEVKESRAALIEDRDLMERRVSDRTLELQSVNAELREQTMRLELALDASQGGVSCWDVVAGTLNWDKRMRELYGFEPDAEVSLDGFFARQHPADRKTLKNDMLAINDPGAGDRWNHEFRIMHPVLGERWIGRLGRVERDDQGRALRALGISFDITARKKNEELLRRSEEKFRRLHESMMDAFAMTDLNGRFIESNRVYQEMLGYTHDELRRMTYQDLTPEEWHSLEEGHLAGLFARGYTDLYEKEYRRKDGSVFPVEIRAFLIRDAAGTPESLWAIARDITQRKQAGRILQEWNQDLERRVAARTHELNQSEARFRQLAEATFEGIVVSEGGIMLDGNPQIAEMCGYELSEMIGRPIADFIAPDSRELVAGRIASGNCDAYECCGLRRDGTTLPLEVRASMRTWQGRQMRVTAVRDLTSIKQAAARMQAQQTELAHAQRLALISEVSAGIVHQIGQPLCAIGANIAYALSGSPSCDPSQCRHLEVLEEIHSDIERMRKTVTHLRALANPDMPTRKRCDINELIGSVISLLKEEAEYRNVSLVFDSGQGLPPVLADSVQFSQVIINLVRNAFDACADRVPDERMVRIISCPSGEGGVEMKVIDSGIGIDKEILPRLFTPFVTTKPEGTGIGLRLSRTIVHAHGGRISGINNSDAPGATFSVILPAHLA